MRKKRHEEHVNHEAWAIPYADLMTLLLAFFVVMYAVSVVNEGKFRVMSASMMEAFNGSDHVMVSPTPGKAPVPSLLQLPATNIVPTMPISVPQPKHLVEPMPAVVNHVGQPAPAPLQHIEHQVQQVLQPLIDKKLVILRRTPDRLEIEIRTDILFPSGVAKLSATANQVLLDLATTLAPFANPLRVEGFTDDVPISTPQYPSNWELSAARAASVARLFAEHGVRPGRLGIVGWGEVRPIADNATEEGRNHNRRVLVVVKNDPQAPADSDGVADRIDAPPPVRQALPALPARYVTAPAGTPPSGSGNTPPSKQPGAADMSALPPEGVR